MQSKTTSLIAGCKPNPAQMCMQAKKMKFAAILSQQIAITIFFIFQFNGTAGICPGKNFISKIPVYFGYFAPTDPNGIYNGQGSVVAVNLALEKINNNDSLLYGYNLFYNGINTTNGKVSDVFDAKVNCTYIICMYA